MVHVCDVPVIGESPVRPDPCTSPRSQTVRAAGREYARPWLAIRRMKTTAYPVAPGKSTSSASPLPPPRSLPPNLTNAAWNGGHERPSVAKVSTQDRAGPPPACAAPILRGSGQDGVEADLVLSLEGKDRLLDGTGWLLLSFALEAGVAVAVARAGWSVRPAGWIAYRSSGFRRPPRRPAARWIEPERGESPNSACRSD